MKPDYYVDSVLGEWKHDKKKTTKKNLCYTRKATVVLHKDHAINYIDPEDYNEYKVHGEVILKETKLLDIKTSLPSFFRGLELTKNSIKTPIIK